MVKARPPAWVLVLLTAVVLLSSGCTTRPDGDDGPPPEPPWVVYFEQGDMIQTNITFWDTQFEVTSSREPEEHPIADVFLSFFDADRSELPNPNIIYRDRDGDNNVSQGDVILVQGLTDEYQGGWFDMTDLEELIGFSKIEWYTEDQRVLTIGLSWHYPAIRNGTMWDTLFQTTHHRTEIPMDVENVSFEVVDEDGTVMEVAQVVFNDTDGNGMVSPWDRVELYGATPDYQGAGVRFFYDGTLVGLGKLPNFIPTG